MNLLWVVVLALFIFLQKIITFGALFTRLVGIGLVAECMVVLNVNVLTKARSASHWAVPPQTLV